MPRGKKFTAEQIIAKLREAEVELARGKKVPEAAKKIGVTEQTYYRWKKEYGGLRIDQAKRLKDLEKEYAETAVGHVDAADYIVWRKMVSQAAGFLNFSPSGASEPSTAGTLIRKTRGQAGSAVSLSDGVNAVESTGSGA